jgi:thiamine-phosphate pyrophosphorylase
MWGQPPSAVRPGAARRLRAPDKKPMADRCLLYYITDRTAFAPDEPTRRHRLLEKISQAARAGVDYIQLREKDLPNRDLESLAQEAVRAIREAGKLTPGPRALATALLINSRTDVALAVEADGVHLRSDDISPQDVRKIWQCGADTPVRQISPQDPLIAVSCHSPAEAAQAAANGATFAVLAPVFEKKDFEKKGFEKKGAHPAGLEMLRQACQAKIPVLALGGITLDNARSCLEAGAAGIAAIRLFQDNDIAAVVHSLRQKS